MLEVQNNIIEAKKINLNIFYRVYFVLMFFGESMQLDVNNTFYQIIATAAITNLFIKLLFTKYSSKELIFSSILTIMSVLIYLNTGKIAVIFTVLSIIGAKNIAIENLLKNILQTQLVVILLNLLLPLLKLKESIMLTHTRVYLGHVVTVTRYGFGFDHPNTLHFSIFVVISILIYLNYQKYKIKNYLLFFILNFITYGFTQSRTGLICSVLIILLAIVFRKINIKKIKYGIILLPIFFAVINIIMGYLFSYSSKLFLYVDQFIQGRLNYSNYFLEKYPVSLFGNEIIFDSWQIIDSSYIEMYITYGLIFFIIFMLATTILLKRSIESDTKKILIITIVFLIFGNMEVFLPNIFKNYSLIFLSTILFKNKIKI